MSEVLPYCCEGCVVSPTCCSPPTGQSIMVNQQREAVTNSRAESLNCQPVRLSVTGTALNKYIFYSYLDSVILHQKHRLKDSIREGQILLLLCFENTQVKENCLI